MGPPPSLQSIILSSLLSAAPFLPTHTIPDRLWSSCRALRQTDVHTLVAYLLVLPSNAMPGNMASHPGSVGSVPRHRGTSVRAAGFVVC